VKSFEPFTKIEDNVFSFYLAKHKGIDVVDLRSGK
jgi:hypothetical protein